MDGQTNKVKIYIYIFIHISFVTYTNRSTYLSQILMLIGIGNIRKKNQLSISQDVQTDGQFKL